MTHKPEQQSTSASRRGFLKMTATAAITSAVAPTILHAADKSGDKLPVLGSGSRQFEAIHGWGELPAHVVWGETHGVAVDEAGLIYIKHRSTAPSRWTRSSSSTRTGKFVRSFGKEYHGGGHGIDIRKEGGEEFLYLCDVKNGLVAKTTLKGEQRLEEELSRASPASTRSGDAVQPRPTSPSPPTAGSTSPTATARTTSTSTTRTPSGSAPGAATGTEAGQDARRRTASGSTTAPAASRRWSSPTAPTPGCNTSRSTASPSASSTTSAFPAHFDIRGDVLLVPDLHARVTLFDKDNKVIDHLGYDQAWTKQVLDGFKMSIAASPTRWQAGRFVHPHDACFDKDGNIFVVEWVPTGRVSFLRHVS